MTKLKVNVENESESKTINHFSVGRLFELSCLVDDPYTRTK